MSNTDLNMFRGTWTALVTPFTADCKQVDWASFDKLLQTQVEAKIAGIVVAGTTGEAATLSDEEYFAVMKRALDLAGTDIKICAGIGSSSTSRAVELASKFLKIGVSSIMVSAPPYNRPTQSGLLAHFRAVYNACQLPIMAYNVPGRSGTNILPLTLTTLAKEGTIRGIKEACGSVDQILDLLSMLNGAANVLSGDDALTVPLMAVGAKGVVSVASNIEPRKVLRITDAAERGDFVTARNLAFDLLPLVRAIFCESNPIPTKAALALRGIIANPTPRLPLTVAEESTVRRLREVLSL